MWRWSWCLVAGLLAAACDDEDALTERPVVGEVVPDAVDFGEVPIGLTETREVAIRNTGEVNLTVDDFAVPSGFSLQRSKGALGGNTIAPSNELVLEVTFIPTFEGPRQDILTVFADGLELEVELVGVGVSRQVARLVVDPQTVDFGTVSVDGVSQTQVVVTNTGNADAVVSQVIADASGIFGVRTPVPFTVVVGQAVSVDVRFAPVRAGVFTDTMRFIARTGSVDLRVSGRSIQPNGDVLCAPAVIDFAGVARGDTARREVTCTAAGGPARILRTEVLGDDGFSLVEPSRVIDLAAGVSVTLPVEFRADGLAGLRRGDLQVEYDGGGGASVRVLPLEAQVTPPPSSKNDVTLVLRWDSGGTDVDLHLLRPGGVFFTKPGDCYYANRAPDWGEPGQFIDNPFLDVDNTTGFGPETINLTRAPPGQYQVWVHFYRGPFEVPTQTTVDVFLGGRSVGSYTQPLTCKRRWLVGFINWNGSSGSFAPDDFQRATSQGDCLP